MKCLFGRDLDILKFWSTSSFKLIFPVKGTSKASSGFKVLGSWIKRSVLQLKTAFFSGGHFTLPETNRQLAPESGWLEYDRFLLGWPMNRGVYLATPPKRLWKPLVSLKKAFSNWLNPCFWGRVRWGKVDQSWMYNWRFTTFSQQTSV